MSIIGNPLIIGGGEQETPGIVYILDKDDGNGGTILEITTEDGIITDTMAPDGSTIRTITGPEVWMEERWVTPTEEVQEVEPREGYDALAKVTVDAIPSDYIGSDVPVKTSSDLTVSGVTVTAPAGYYSSQATKSVATGTAGTPTATKGSVSNHSVTITPSVTNTTGYITGGTKTGTDVQVTAAELVSGSETKTQNGTFDVTNLASLVVDVPPVGYDVPTFTGTLGGNGMVFTCDKTFAEAKALADYGLTAALVIINSYGAAAYNVREKDSSHITYEIIGRWEIEQLTYYSNGTIEWDSDVFGRSSDDIIVSGATVTVPDGMYESTTTVTVSSLTLPTSTSSSATSGYTSKATITPSTSDQYLNIGTGYNSTASYYKINAMSTMTLPTSAASSATSGYSSKATIGRSTSAQYINIPPGYNSTGAYYTISATPNGTATAPSTISGTSATVSTGTNTITLTKTVSVTPTISTAGYISSGTAGNSSVSLTASVTTQGAKTVTPSTSSQTAVAAGTYVTGAVTVSAMPSGTAGTPTATKGSVSNHSITVTPSVTNETGYITGGTKTGTGVTVSASELVSGSQTITESDTYDVTNLAQVVVDIQSGASTWDEVTDKPFDEDVDIPTFTPTWTGSGTTDSSGQLNFASGSSSIMSLSAGAICEVVINDTTEYIAITSSSNIRDLVSTQGWTLRFGMDTYYQTAYARLMNYTATTAVTAEVSIARHYGSGTTDSSGYAGLASLTYAQFTAFPSTGSAKVVVNNVAEIVPITVTTIGGNTYKDMISPNGWMVRVSSVEDLHGQYSYDLRIQGYTASTAVSVSIYIPSGSTPGKTLLAPEYLDLSALAAALLELIPAAEGASF